LAATGVSAAMLAVLATPAMLTTALLMAALFAAALLTAALGCTEGGNSRDAGPRESGFADHAGEAFAVQVDAGTCPPSASALQICTARLASCMFSRNAGSL